MQNIKQLADIKYLTYTEPNTKQQKKQGNVSEPNEVIIEAIR